MRLFFALLIICSISLSCKNDKVGNNNNESAKVQVVVEEKEQTKLSLPAINKDQVQDLALNCDFVDYIFYELPISISQDNKQAILSNINFISREPVESYSSSCKPMGRKSFMSKGEMMLEADVYLNKKENCFFYVFLVDGKPTYANRISNDGVNFYFNIFGQAGVKKE